MRIAESNDNDNINIIEEAKNITIEDLEKYFNDLSLEADKQEVNLKRLISRMDEFNQVFDKEIELAFKNSIFEYKIDHILLVEKENSKYIIEKNKCPNKVIRILFHGTNANVITKIFPDKINISIGNYGNGVYFTDKLDYAWYYGGKTNRANFYKIPGVGDFFTCVACEIFYDNSKIETIFDDSTQGQEVKENGIRCIYVDNFGRVIKENELKEYKKFIGKEYLITCENQILPLYGITFKRVDYLVIWRDYNFDPQNPNKYSEDTFDEIQEFHRKIKKFIARELNSKIYYINTNEEALELLKRKKYNKIIIISNGNNNGVDFIIESRKIIGANSIAS